MHRKILEYNIKSISIWRCSKSSIAFWFLELILRHIFSWYVQQHRQRVLCNSLNDSSQKTVSDRRTWYTSCKNISLKDEPQNWSKNHVTQPFVIVTWGINGLYTCLRDIAASSSGPSWGIRGYDSSISCVTSHLSRSLCLWNLDRSD